LVRLTAHWCHWCRVLEHEVLPNPEVRAAIARSYDAMVIDVDAYPSWMDLPGVEGLPVLAFFDANGRHVLTRSGYREAADLAVLFDAVAHGLSRGEIEPYPEPAPPALLADFEGMDRARARTELERIERALYIEVNSNDGGFSTPARRPQPEVLFELQRWAERTPRAQTWIELTLAHALRGHSPRLDGEPLDALEYDAAALIELSAKGPDLGQRWRDAVDRLPNLDPYRGLQDPVDHGVFRYAAGPGWYHPHYERRAMDNLAWALLLRARGREQEADDIYAFVVETFGRGQPSPAPLDTAQQSDPFYFRLTAAEREGVAPPKVWPLWNLDVQARAALFDPSRCVALERVRVDRWPLARWIDDGEDEAGQAATVDAVGELLIALSTCPGQADRARALAQVVIERWRDVGVVANARSNRLAAGVCQAAPEHCAQVLATVEGLALDLRFAPPLAELAELAGG
jgi:hypothetical protein